jgi:HEAT repeat protein
MSADCDHEAVRESGDRSWTLPLLDTVRDPLTSDDDREESFETLRILDDPRSVAPLTELLEDASLPDEWRDRASDALRWIDDTTTPAQCRAWWATGDLPLMRHALLSMWRSEADIVVPVADDPSHPLHAAGIDALTDGFDGPEFTPIVIRALRHPEPEVRASAAEILFWNEPVVAELPLTAAAYDEERDVAVEVLLALQYFPTRRVLRALSQIAADADDIDVRERATEAFEDVQATFAEMASEARSHGDGGAAMRAWMQPVADLVPWPDAVPETDRDSDDRADDDIAAAVAEGEQGTRVSEAEVAALVGSPDSAWKVRGAQLRGVQWSAFDDDERSRLGALLRTHDDAHVRMFALRASAAWNQPAAIEARLFDESQAVRRAAAHYLGAVPPEPAVAESLWAHLQSVDVDGWGAFEAIKSYARHAPADEAVPRLEGLARDDVRPDVRTYAVRTLEQLEAKDAIDRLSDLLLDAPPTNWDLHIALIDARRELGMPCPDLSHLELVDDVNLMASVCASLAAGVAAED